MLIRDFVERCLSRGWEFSIEATHVDRYEGDGVALAARYAFSATIRDPNGADAFVHSDTLPDALDRVMRAMDVEGA